MTAYQKNAFFNTAVYDKRLTLDKTQCCAFFNLKLETDFELIIKLEKYAIIGY